MASAFGFLLGLSFVGEADTVVGDAYWGHCGSLLACATSHYIGFDGNADGAQIYSCTMPKVT